MSDREAFVSAIAANPDDDLPRLVFADWLEENGEPERADFIRTQIRWHHAFPDERKELDLKADKLFREHWLRWFGPLLIALEPGINPAEWHEPRVGTTTLGGVIVDVGHAGSEINLDEHWDVPSMEPPHTVRYFSVKRGFADHLTVNVDRWKQGASLAEIFQCEPIHQFGCISRQHPPSWARFTDPVLRRVKRFGVTHYCNWDVSAPDCTALLEDPHLAGVWDFSFSPMVQYWGAVFGRLPVAWVESFVRSSLAGQLTGLSLGGINSEGIRQLCSPGRLNLERLQLSFCAVHDRTVLNGESVRQLGNSGLSESVRELSLPFFAIKNDGVVALARDEWKSLSRLNLKNNELTAAVLPALASAKFTPRLVKLDLSQNELFTGAKGDLARLHKLADALDPERLEHLDLAGNGLSHVPDFLGERFGERVTV